MWGVKGKHTNNNNNKKKQQKVIKKYVKIQCQK